MKKTVASSAFILALALSLSGCSFGVSSTTTAADPTPSSDNAVPTPAPIPSSIECDGGPISVDGDNATATYIGQCGDITISANDASLEFEATGLISIVGESNLVVVEDIAGNVSINGTLNKVIAGGINILEVAGTYNTVSSDWADSVAVTGESNYVQWLTGVKTATDSGIENTIVTP